MVLVIVFSLPTQISANMYDITFDDIVTSKCQFDRMLFVILTRSKFEKMQKAVDIIYRIQIPRSIIITSAKLIEAWMNTEKTI